MQFTIRQIKGIFRDKSFELSSLNSLCPAFKSAVRAFCCCKLAVVEMLIRCSSLMQLCSLLLLGLSLKIL